MKTTFIKKKSEMTREVLFTDCQDGKGCHGGNGPLVFIDVLGANDPGGEYMCFMHDDILPPKSSIGIHTHTEKEQEYYYILSGSGVMTLDGKEYDVHSGDIAAVLPGGQHGLENRADEDLRLIVICVTRRVGSHEEP